ncbi:MAG: HAD-IC family P-type ATPase [Bacilli bacterium]|nr:HAD-IC family P-type ATPase [Bacilli bacterium]
MEAVDIKKGLTSKEVSIRVNKGLVNYDDAPKTKTIKEIIRDNFFTYFNYLNLALGLAVFIASVINGNVFYGLKNCLFMGVIIVNSIISIIEEIISKKIIDKLAVVSETKVDVLRDGEIKELTLEEIVLDDIIKLSLGHQIVADSVILEGELEVNESLITGESDSIKKKKGDELLSGSFIVSGNATAKVIHVGKDNYVAKISNEAKYKKDVNSVVMESFTKMLKILSILIIPIGIVMLINQYMVTNNLPESIFTTVASLIGMIPEGLVLLTSSVMAVGVIKLYRVHVLVQQLYAIETLARVDAICLDKTGTLTEGKMAVCELIPAKNHTKNELEDYLSDYTLASEDTNQTMMALKDFYQGDKIEANDKVSFSSDRKYSAIEFDNYSLYLGAPDVLLKSKVDKKIDKYIEDYRVLALGIKKGKIDTKLKSIECVGYILIEDVIRPSAKDTLEYFKNNDVLVKIISGDNVKTVMSIARKVGLTDINGIDIGDLTNEELDSIIDEYQIFGRVKPEQKKYIIQHLKKQGHTVAMTGDGVNDVLALKESDCAISVKSGTDAARNVSQLILLDDDFNSLPKVVAEGRQTINNVQRSASLLLVKTLYTIMLIIFSIVSFQKYFFIPIQLTFITTFTIGAPSFILALEPNSDLVSGNFLFKVFAKALPTALTVVFNVVIVSAFSSGFSLSYELQSTISVILTTITGLYYLFKICYPLNVYRGTLFGVMTLGFIYCLFFQPTFFNLVPMNNVSWLIVIVLALDSFYIYKLLNFAITAIFSKLDKTIKVESDIYKVS